MEEPVFVKCEPVWPEDTEETSNFEENAVHSFDNGVKIKDDPHAAITDLSLEESSVNVKDEEQTVVEQVLCFKEENNLEDIAVLSKGPVHSRDPIKCQLHTVAEEKLPPPSLCGNTLSQECYIETQLLPVSRGKCHVCSICNSSFSQKFRLNDHMLTHSKPQQCTKCNKNFARKSHLDRHLLTHSTERSYCCNICSRKFKAKDTLKKHSSIHTDMACTVEQNSLYPAMCGKSFKLKKSVLQVHMIYLKIPWCFLQVLWKCSQHPA
ncbi:zinc finger protein 12 isoform X2 [Anabrus simplex]|uniref:zinc finger protein 12 isoform X2 n=1 Tax=Anabrus simplex TaxID=316456 RepID=UPI0035A373EB